MNNTLVDTIAAVNAALQDDPARFLERARRTGWICPRCGNGAGKDGSGIGFIPGSHRVKCHKCDFCGDALDIVKAQEGTEMTTATALDAACRRAGVLPPGSKAYTQQALQKATAVRTAERRAADAAARKAPAPGLAALETWQAALPGSPGEQYAAARGISLSTATRYGIGYAAAWKNPSAAAAPTTPRLIIPTGAGGYTARAIDPGTPPQYQKQKAGPAGMFNAAALDADGAAPVFIVEGELDALSFLEIGLPAVALGGTSGAKLLVDALARRGNHPVILALDNDDAGGAAQERLQASLAPLCRVFYAADRAALYLGKKDANDALCHDRAAFNAAALAAVAALQAEKDAEKAEYRALYSAAHALDELRRSALEDTEPAMRSGLAEVDRYLDGGFRAGLHILGAVPSAGKTTLALQIADELTKQGVDVLFFSLEMSRAEVLARCVSRKAALLAAENASVYLGNATLDTFKHAPSARRVQCWGEMVQRGRVTPQEDALLSQAYTACAATAGNLFILEGLGNVAVDQVRAAIQRHIAMTGKAPAVMVDYVQILMPPDECQGRSDKQIADFNVLQLKRIAREFKCFVLAISSFNRTSYDGKANMGAFKESGALEYGADVLFSMQHRGAGEKGADDVNQKEKAKDKRAIDLHILKNRHGRITDPDKPIPLQYFSRVNLFVQETM